MSDIRNRRDLELRAEPGLDRGLEETGIELLEGEYASAQTCLAPPA
jgi:hypothetical protein